MVTLARCSPEVENDLMYAGQMGRQHLQQQHQAQMISLALMLFGAVGFVWAGKSPIIEKQKVD
jgi:hypothetical protein